MANFTQMHERLRLELLRRIQRGTLSVSLLARQTSIGQPHLSNFLNGKRKLSLEAMDRVLTAQQLSTEDLVASPRHLTSGRAAAGTLVPLVSHTTALFEPYIRASAALGSIHLPEAALQSIRPRVSPTRKAWERFVAIRINSQDALAMEPIVQPEAILLIDRHYDSLAAYRPTRPNLYAIRSGANLMVRYAEFLTGRLVLRPHSLTHPIELIEISPDETPRDLIAGRIALILNES